MILIDFTDMDLIQAKDKISQIKEHLGISIF